MEFHHLDILSAPGTPTGTQQRIPDNMGHQSAEQDCRFVKPALGMHFISVLIFGAGVDGNRPWAPTFYGAQDSLGSFTL